MRLLISETVNRRSKYTVYTHNVTYMVNVYCFCAQFSKWHEASRVFSATTNPPACKNVTFITVFRLSVLVQRNTALYWLIQTETARTMRLSIKSTDLVTILTVRWTRYNGMLLPYSFKSILARRKWGAVIDCMNCE